MHGFPTTLAPAVALHSAPGNMLAPLLLAGAALWLAVLVLKGLAMDCNPVTSKGPTGCVCTSRSGVVAGLLVTADKPSQSTAQYSSGSGPAVHAGDN